MTDATNTPAVYEDNGTPLHVQAKRIADTEGRSLRAVTLELRESKKKLDYVKAIKTAPEPKKNDDGTYERISNDPRWPFGVFNGEPVAPNGTGPNGLPKVIAADVKKMAPTAKKEARDLIVEKLKRMGCDPIAIMAELAMSGLVKDEVRLRAATELSSMIYPRLKGVENTIKQENTTFVIAVPAEKPETGTEWLASAEGARRLHHQEVIDVEAVEVKSEEA